jgi:hypothetical protein
MHLLIKSKSENKMYNTKTVKELIFKGAERDAKNIKGETPYNLLHLIETGTIKNELEKILGE